MIDYIIDYATDAVALRKESVDRNIQPPAVIVKMRMSLSARRAWIEIVTLNRFGTLKQVALRKESVDRNHAADISARRGARCRSPQGERG